MAQAQIIELSQIPAAAHHQHQFRNDDELVTVWLRSQKSQATIRAYEKASRDFMLFCCRDNDLANVTISDCQDWQELMIRKGLQPASINNKVSAIKSLYKFGYRTLYLSGGINPMDYIQYLPVKKKREDKCLTYEELLALIEQAHTENHLKKTVIFLSLTTALRRGGMLSVQQKHLRPLANDPTYGGNLEFRNKGGETESTPVPHNVWNLIYDPAAPPDRYILESRQNPGQPLCGQRVNDIIREVSRNAGIKRWRKITSHFLRHTAASRAFENGADIETVRKILKHQSIRTTQQYIHTTENGLGEVFEGLI